MLLKDGRVIEGSHVQVAGVAENPLDIKITAGEVAVLPLLMFDDGLRRTFIHYGQVAQMLENRRSGMFASASGRTSRSKGAGIGRIGRGRPLGPFDEFGRRTFEMQSRDGPLSVVQGITEITPTYTKIEGLMGAPRPVVWDMRLATSSIPRELLGKILKTAVPQDDVDARLEVVRLYLQSERYRDAEQELAEIIKDFPQHENLNEQIRQLRQLGASLILKEIQLRAKAGQRQLAQTLLAKFPNEGVSGATLEQVRELLTKYEADEPSQAGRARGAQCRGGTHHRRQQPRAGRGFCQGNRRRGQCRLARPAGLVRAPRRRERADRRTEGGAGDQRLAGGRERCDRRFSRRRVAGPGAESRAALSGRAARRRAFGDPRELADQPAATVPRVAQLLKLMKPPLDVPEDAKRGPGLYELTVPGLPGENDARYYLQLPPEYDPLRRYPVIVALADAGVPPQAEIEFWAGPPRADGEPLGQATRHGYITIAVEWLQPKQTAYGYSAREHHAVLGSLRDASRRFSIDTDRVFLTGHGVGGDAAWDIALAHPDIWAGVMPFVATAEKYCQRYAANAEYVSWYFVCGELDGDKMSRNARELDRYFGRNKDNTVVEYLGRGYEPFGDELQRLFDWMGRRSRKMPQEFQCVTMRPWDNFFWWLEVGDLPDKSMIAPASWPPPRSARPFPVLGKIGNANRISAKTQAGETSRFGWDRSSSTSRSRSPSSSRAGG